MRSPRRMMHLENSNSKEFHHASAAQLSPSKYIETGIVGHTHGPEDPSVFGFKTQAYTTDIPEAAMISQHMMPDPKDEHDKDLSSFY